VRLLVTTRNAPPSTSELTPELCEQLSIYVREWREATDRDRSSQQTLIPALGQLRAFAQDMQDCLRDSQQAAAAFEQVCTSVLEWLIQQADRRDGESLAHARRVAVYSRILAEAVILPAERTAHISAAARYHDTGKISWPDAILLKSAPLTPDEREFVQSHCSLARLLSGTGNARLETIAMVMACHHERWDGSGYPDGLVGEAIPLDARIVQLADIYDALRTPHRYKPAQSHAAACRAILQGDRHTSPGHFAPHLLDAFGRAERKLDAACREDATQEA
jgi:putative two-component system response regulator